MYFHRDLLPTSRNRFIGSKNQGVSWNTRWRQIQFAADHTGVYTTAVELRSDVTRCLYFRRGLWCSLYYRLVFDYLAITFYFQPRLSLSVLLNLITIFKYSRFFITLVSSVKFNELNDRTYFHIDKSKALSIVYIIYE